MDLDLSGRTAVITGGSAGIGLAVAKAFAAEGCNLHLIARNAARLESAAQELRATGVSVHVHPLDIADSAALVAAIDRCSEADVLVNNAGAAPPGSIETVDEAQWRAAWDVKVFGTINATRAMLRHMYPRRRGVVINVIGGGVLTRYDYACGTAGNAALHAFTTAVGSRSTDKGVRVLGINPTATRTERIFEIARARAKERFGDEQRWNEVLVNLPFGRLCEPEEVAAAIVFAASARSSYLSGTCVNLDGGAPHR